jgi:hypothetical protein
VVLYLGHPGHDIYEYDRARNGRALADNSNCGMGSQRARASWVSFADGWIMHMSRKVRRSPNDSGGERT